MKHFHTIFFLLSCFCGNTFAQSASENILGSGFGSDIIESADHNFIFTGGDGTRVLISKIDSAGNTLWVKFFGLTTGLTPNNSGTSITYISDNKYVITGNYEPGTSSFHNLYAIMIDTSGNEIWEHNFGNGNCYGTNVTFDSINQTIYFVGSAHVSNSDILVVKTDTAGNLIWNQYFDYGNNDYGEKISLRNENDIFIAGGSNSMSGNNYNDGILLEIDSTGTFVGINSYGGNSADIFYDFKILPDNSFFVLGNTQSFGAGLQDGWLLRLNSLGDTLWTKTYGDTIGDNLHHFAFSNSNTIWLCGYSNTLSPNFQDAWLLEIDTSGNTLYNKHFGNTNYEMTFSIIESSFNSIFAIGESDTNSFQQIYLIRLDSVNLFSSVPYDNLVSSNQLFAYPNPTNDISFLQLPSDFDFNFLKIDVRDLLGRTFIQNAYHVKNNLIAIYLPSPSGIYSITIQDDKKIFQTQIIKN